MSVKSAARKPENYRDPVTGKMKVRMVPVTKDAEIGKKTDAPVTEKKTDRWYKSQPEWGTPESGKKARKQTPGQQVEEKDPNEYDKEGEMMKNQLRQICSANEKLMKMVGDDDNLPEWVQNKITKATDYIRTVRDYLEAENGEDEDDDDDDMNEEMMTAADAGIPQDTKTMGPRYKPTTVVDKRRRKEKAVLLKRFRKHLQDNA